MKFEGKTLEEALEKAQNELKITKEEFIYSKEEIKGGLFKSGSISITIHKYDDVIVYAKEFLKEILEKMGMEVNFESKIREGQITIKMFSSNNALLIGKNGKNLDALQTILKQAIYTKFNAYAFIMLDVENYKDKQVSIIERIAKNIAREVLRTKIDVKLDNMNSYERRIVHNVLTNFKNITTISEGEEPNRHIIVKYDGE